jgi:hypothetical protein
VRPRVPLEELDHAPELRQKCLGLKANNTSLYNKLILKNYKEKTY